MLRASGLARNWTRDLSVASPTLYRSATTHYSAVNTQQIDHHSSFILVTPPSWISASEVQFCLRYSTHCRRRHMFSGCPSAAAFVRPSVRPSVRTDLLNGFSSLDETYRQQPIAHTDDLIRFWRPEVKGQGHSSLSRWRPRWHWVAAWRSGSVVGLDQRG